jgi:hypothetical protein
MSCEDQALSETLTCTKFECHKALLEPKGGFYCCPVCEASYGRQPHPFLPPLDAGCAEATMSEHTPGPWKAVRERLSPGREWRIEAADAENYNWHICQCFDLDGEANARLIAAAPELLAAVEAAVVAFEGRVHSRECLAVVAQARAASAKARGED